MIKEIKIITLLLLLLANPSKANFPNSWGIGQRVHVKFTDFTPEDKALMTAYIKKQIDPLHLDIKLVFDDNVLRSDGLKEGIEIRNVIGTTSVCAKTRTFGGLASNGSWAVVKLVQIDTTCEGGTRESDPILWTNQIFHEFNHALFMDHIENKDRIIPPVLMFADVYLAEVPELFSFADKWQLKRKYNRNQLVNYKRINFKRADLGKWCYLARGNRSVAFKIEQQSELLPYLGKLEKYKRKIR